MNTPRLCLPLLALFGVGCGYQVQQHSVLEEMQHAIAETPRPAVEGGLIEERLDVSVAMAPEGLFLADSDESRRDFQSVEVSIPPSVQGDSRTELLQEGLESLHEERGMRITHQVVDAAPALAMALDYHLRRYFRDPHVVIQGTEGFVVGLSGGSHLALTKRASMTLLTLRGPAPIQPAEGDGVRRTGPHLGWAIPVTLVTGTLGALLVGNILGRISSSHYRSAIARAVDEAAAAWAAQVAAAWHAAHPQVATNGARSL